MNETSDHNFFSYRGNRHCGNSGNNIDGEGKEEPDGG
jgi:hypothetical protein